MAATGVVTDQEAAETRARREQTWAVHRRTLDVASADAFELVLRQDDIIGVGRFSHISELAKLHQSEQARAVTKADLDRAVERKDRAVATVAKIDAEIASEAGKMGAMFSPCLPLAELDDWLVRRQKALEARDAVRGAERDIRAAQSDAAKATERLRSALDRAGFAQNPEVDFDVLCANAKAALDQESDLARLRAESAERQCDLGLREQASEEAKARESVWVDEWSKTCSGCWIGEQGTVPALAVVREILAVMADLMPAVEKRAGLADRIQKMEKDQTVFRDEVASLAGALEISTASGHVLELAQSIAQKVREAGARRDRQAELSKKLEEARERERGLAEKLAIHSQEKAQMTSFFEVASLAEVVGRLRTATIIEMPGQLRGYDSEYHFLCHKMLQFEAVGEGHSEYWFMMPNVIRRVLEIFLAFKIPGSHPISQKLNTLEKKIPDFDKARIVALERLTQVESHSDSLEDLIAHSSMTIEETRDSNAAMLALMAAADEDHAKAIRSQCKAA